MSKKIYSVSLNLEKEFNSETLTEEVKGYSFCEIEQEIVDETVEYYNVKNPNSTFISQIPKSTEFKGKTVILPESTIRVGEHSTDFDLIPKMKQQLVSFLIAEIQSKHQEAQSAYLEFKRYQTSFKIGEKQDKNTFFEELILKLAYVKNKLRERSQSNQDSERTPIVNTGISFLNGKTYVYAEYLWAFASKEVGFYELVNDCFETVDKIESSQFNKIARGDSPDFPHASIRIQGDFDTYEIASQLQESMAEQVDSFLLNSQYQMEKNLSLALSLKANI